MEQNLNLIGQKLEDLDDKHPNRIIRKAKKKEDVLWNLGEKEKQDAADIKSKSKSKKNTPIHIDTVSDESED